MQIPDLVRNFIKERNQRSTVVSGCNSCDSICCSAPGFALLENVNKIFEVYQTGSLSRDDYEFEKELDLCAFVYKYFDRVAFNSLLVFFPKTLTKDRNVVSIPPWNYYQAREYIQNRTEKKGCIFLSKQFDKNVTGNRCTLHDEEAIEKMSSKPIDCVFLTCSQIGQVIKPSPQESSLWFAMLDYYFPNSIERFNQLCSGLPI